MTNLISGVVGAILGCGCEFWPAQRVLLAQVCGVRGCCVLHGAFPSRSHWCPSLPQAYAMMLSLSENAPLHTSSQNSLGAWLDMAGAASESGTFNPINHL